MRRFCCLLLCLLLTLSLIPARTEALEVSAAAAVLMDADTGELLNDQPQGVLIGDHCWIGQGATFTKNAIIPANTVVGLQSVVTKSFREEFTALAGNPAKVIKKGVKWSREREMG